MNITVPGTGYVGLVTGTCFAEMGNSVTCVDIDKTKIENLRRGILPIYEPGLAAMVKENQEKGTLTFTTGIEGSLQGAEICFIAVGTPMGEDGSADLHYVLDAAKSIGRYLNPNLIVVDKSTVPVGTAEKVRGVIAKELLSKGCTGTYKDCRGSRLRSPYSVHGRGGKRRSKEGYCRESY